MMNQERRDRGASEIDQDGEKWKERGKMVESDWRMDDKVLICGVLWCGARARVWN